MIKSRAMVSGFAIAIAIHLGFSIAAGCFSIYAMFTRDSQAALDSCLQKANDVSNAMQSCKRGLILIKAVTVVIYVLTWLIQLCNFFLSLLDLRRALPHNFRFYRCLLRRGEIRGSAG